MTTEQKQTPYRPLYRVWVNQPSRLQPCHDYHGCNLIADLDAKDPNGEKSVSVDVYFLSGPVVSARLLRSVLSLGWQTQSPQKLQYPVPADELAHKQLVEDSVAKLAQAAGQMNKVVLELRSLYL